MRHRISGRQLNRTSEHRRAMFRNLAAGLFEHGQIETTLPKAKAVQPYVEKIITLAKKGTFTARRRIEQRLNDRKIHAWVADPNVPDSKKDNPFFDLPDAGEIEFNRYGEVRKAPRLVQHVMTKIAERYEDRNGGYTRIIRTGRNRLGDGTDIVLLQLVGEEDGPEVSGDYSGRRTQANRRAAFAAKLRKSGGDERTETASEEESATATAVAEPEAAPETNEQAAPADEATDTTPPAVEDQPEGEEPKKE
jgi:large subunit ribosomal protein L17